MKRDFEFSNEELVKIAKEAAYCFKSPSFQFYPDKWLSSGKIMTMENNAIGSYILMLAYSWSEPDCGLENKDTVLAKFARCSNEVFATIKTQLMQHFFTIDERVYNRRLLLERMHQIRRSDSARFSVSKRYTNVKRTKNERTTNDLRSVVLNTRLELNTEEELKPDTEIEKEFIAFLDMRKSIRKPVKTIYAKNLLIKKLNKLSGGDIEKKREILNASIESSYQGLFPLKTDKQKCFGRQDVSIAELKQQMDGIHLEP